MATADLRPMTLGEVLDRTFTLYKRNFWLFAGIMSFPLLLVFFAQVGIAAFRTTAPGTPGSSAVFVGVFGRFVILMIVSMVMYAIAQAATIFAVSDLYLGRTATVRAAFGKVRGRVLRTIGVIFLVGLIVMVGFIALIIPGIILMCKTGVAVPAAMLEDKSAGEAVGRSMDLTKGYAMQMFLIFLLAWVLAVVAAAVFQYPFMFLAIFKAARHQTIPFVLLVLQYLSSFVSSVLVGPVATIAFSLMYYNLRVRKEAFDLQHLITLLPADSQPVSPVPGAPSAA
ncbi:MAG TPA: hypothetical protein VGS27_05475 [Candidatus Sulfotelmatobacter sp.]|nr:hypothetical protein [Candidatus Sulfotelmatobacter sp.]